MTGRWTDAAAGTDAAEDDPDAAPDFEGPRRRARRERDERRAAQARATAIEEARREAKRRAPGSRPTADQARRARRGSGPEGAAVVGAAE